MLVLSRHDQETITLILPDGSRIRVVVVGIDRTRHSNRPRVRLGFEAAPEVAIVRDATPYVRRERRR